MSKPDGKYKISSLKEGKKEEKDEQMKDNTKPSEEDKKETQ